MNDYKVLINIQNATDRIKNTDCRTAAITDALNASPIEMYKVTFHNAYNATYPLSFLVDEDEDNLIGKLRLLQEDIAARLGIHEDTVRISVYEQTWICKEIIR